MNEFCSKFCFTPDQNETLTICKVVLPLYMKLGRKIFDRKNKINKNFRGNLNNVPCERNFDLQEN